MTDEKEVMVVEGEYVNLGAIRVLGPVDVVRQASAVASELARVIEEQKLYSIISGRRFVVVEGWSTLGAMLGVMPREVSAERQEDGGYIATVELVRVSDGMIIGRGSALCGMDEKDRRGNLTWGSRAEFARRSMAITRATGKAYRLGFSWIVTLAGYEATPAEEMPDDIGRGRLEPPAPAKFDPDNPDAPCTDWGGMFTAAVESLGYNDVEHVKNTLKKKFAGGKGKVSDGWVYLVEHQEAKKAELDDTYSTRAELLGQWTTLWDKAKVLGLKIQGIEIEGMSDDDIAAAVDELTVQITAAESVIPSSEMPKTSRKIPF